MNITINKIPSELSISVVVDGLCNHFAAEYEEMEFAKDSWWEDAHMYVPDDSTIENVLVCPRCEAWQDFDGLWRDEVINE